MPYHLYTSTSPEALIQNLVMTLKKHENMIFNPPLIVSQNSALKDDLKYRIAKHYGVCAFVPILTQTEVVPMLQSLSVLKPNKNETGPVSREILSFNIFHILNQEYLTHQFSKYPFACIRSVVRENTKPLLYSALFNLSFKLAELYQQYSQNSWHLFWNWEALTPQPSTHAHANLSEMEHFQQWLWCRLGLKSMVPDQSTIASLKAVHTLNFEIHIIGSSFLIEPLQELFMILSDKTDIHHHTFTPSHEFWFDTQTPSFDLFEYLKPLGSKAMRFIYDHIDPVETILPAEKAPSTVLEHIRHIFITDTIPFEKIPLNGSDTSLVFHACPEARREAEVCFNQILHVLENNPDLRLEDILITSTHLEDYAPFIHALFESSRISTSSPEDILNIHLNVQAEADFKQSPLHEALSLLLNFYESHDCFNALEQLLKHPFIQNALGLSLSECQFLMAWLYDRNFSLHVDINGRFSARQFTTYFDALRLSFCHAICTGDFTQNDSGMFSLKDSHLSLENMEILSVFFKFLENLIKYIQVIHEHTLSFSAWALFFQNTIQTLIKPLSDTDISFLSRLNAILTDGILYKEAIQKEHDTFILFLEWFSHVRFSIASKHLHRGIRVMPMSMARFNPFKHIFVLGVSEQGFPRDVTPSPLNIMENNRPQLYASLKEVDLYHFLELFYQAEHTLHFFYQAIDPGSREALPLATPILKLQELCSEVFVLNAPSLQTDHALVITHSLEPFAVSTPASLFRGTFLKKDENLLSAFKGQFHLSSQNVSEKKIKDSLSVKSIMRFLKNTAQFYLSEKYGHFSSRQESGLIDYKKIFNPNLQLLKQQFENELYATSKPRELDPSDMIAPFMENYTPLMHTYRTVIDQFQAFKSELNPERKRPLYLLGNASPFTRLFHEPKKYEYCPVRSLTLRHTHPHLPEITSYLPPCFEHGTVVFCHSEKPSEEHFFQGAVPYLLLHLHEDITPKPVEWLIYVFSLKSGEYKVKRLQLSPDSIEKLFTLLLESCVCGLSTPFPFDPDICQKIYAYEEKKQGLSENDFFVLQQTCRDVLERKFEYSPELEIFWGESFDVHAFHSSNMYQIFYKLLRPHFHGK